MKQSHAQVTSKEEKCKFYLIFNYLAWMNFHEGAFRVWQFLKNLLGRLTNISHSPSQIYSKISSCTWKITWHLDKVDKKVKADKVSSWVDAQSSWLRFSFNVRIVYFVKQAINNVIKFAPIYIWYSKKVSS